MRNSPLVLEQTASKALALLLGGLALYGCWSTPGLVERWGLSFAGVAVLAGWMIVAGWCVAGAPSRRACIWFAVVAAAMRLVGLALVAGRESPGDPHWYLVLAQHLLAGDGLYLDDPAMGARAWAEFPPAYPLLLAAWGSLAGLSALSVLVLSTLLDLGSALAIARLGRRLGEERAGWAAAALYLIWPSVLLDAPLAQKESLEMLAVLALAHGWLGAGERGLWRSALAIGGSAGLLALTQPGAAALAGLFGLVSIPRLGFGRMLRVGVAAAVVTVLVMAPWWVRNWHVLGAFVPLTSVGGLSLWIGENPQATGNWMPYPTAATHVPELESARVAGRLAIEWMTQHPWEVARSNAAKFVRAMGIGQFPLVRLAAMRPAPGPAVTAVLLTLVQGAHLLMLAAGAASLWRRASPLLPLLLGVMLQLALVGVWFEFGERHRELLTPFLLLAVTTACARRLTFADDRRHLR